MGLFPARAQAGRARTIGFLIPSSPDATSAEYLAAFRQGLSELGQIEGSDYVLELRWAEGATQRLPGLAADLVKLNVDVLVVWSALAANAASIATKTIPIVQVSGGSPIRGGVAESLARPGGNLTGFTNQSEDLSGKLLELLVSMVPGASRVGALYAVGSPVAEPQLSQVEQTAKSLGVTVRSFGVAGANSLEGVFAEIAREQPHGLVVLSAALFLNLSRRIVELVARERLPAVYPYSYFASDGGLMSYGVNQRERLRRAAAIVDRILKGAKPADLPIEQPTAFELVLNLRTARELGLQIPPTLLARADEVIE
jgi:putative ABC transport system substrate-binding protein